MLITHQQIPLRRWILNKSVGLSSVFARNYSSLPPRKSYHANLSPISLLWNTKVSPTFKYCSLIAILSISMSHIHPNIIVTVGPPVLLGSWYLYSKWMKLQYATETEKLIPKSKKEFNSKDNDIIIKKYNEAEISNVLNGIDNEFDNFKRQVVDIIERRIIDYIISNEDQRNDMFSLFIDENKQVSIKLSENDIETFILLSASVPDFDSIEDNEASLSQSERKFQDFIKLSLPFFSSKDTSNRKRLGTIECYLLEMSNTQETDHIKYKILIEISPYKWFVTSKEKLTIKYIEGEGVYNSKMFNEAKKSRESEEQDDEEITVNI